MAEPISVEAELSLKKVEDLLRECMKTVFSTSINPEARVKLGEIAQYDEAAFRQAFADGIVLVKVPLKDNRGESYLLFAPITAAKIADLMVMGEGSGDFNPDEHIDAIQEITDQIFGAFANSGSEMLIQKPEFEVSSAQYGDASLLQIADDSWTAVEFVLVLEQEHLLFHLLSLKALRNLLPEPPKDASNLKNGSMKDMNEINIGPKPIRFDSFGPEPARDETSRDIDMLMDLELPIIIELGRTSMYIKDILKLAPGSIVELNKLSGDPVDLYVNEKKFAEGEVVVVDENFGIRITELIKPEDRLKKLR